MTAAQGWSVMAHRELAEAALFAETEIDLWPYRDRTVALLKRYARASVEVGRLPSMLGREFFRARVTSYSMASFEDIVIFVHDVETALLRLDKFHQRLIAMTVLEEYNLPEAARLLPCPLRTVEREVPEALDALSGIFLEGGLLREMVS
jgi:DNA-directed RNA polymerase specialized sigma24 family protein